MQALWTAAREYSYLTSVLGYCALALALCATDRRRRRLTLFSGAVCGAVTLLMLPMVPAFESDYWRPRRLFGLPCGVEDVLFGVSIGALAWWLAAVPAHERLRPTAGARVFVKRFVLVHLAVIPVFLLMLWAKLPSIACHVLAQLAAAGLILALAPRFRRLAVAGGLGFGVLYALLVNLSALLANDAAAVWIGTGPLNRLLLAAPLGEYLWGITFGVMWPPLFAWCLDAEPVGGNGHG